MMRLIITDKSYNLRSKPLKNSSINHFEEREIESEGKAGSKECGTRVPGLQPFVYILIE